MESTRILRGFLALLALGVLPAGAFAQTAAEPKTVYECRLSTAAAGGRLSASKAFLADGTPYRATAAWAGERGSFLHLRDPSIDRSSENLTWGDQYTYPGVRTPEIDWSAATVRASAYSFLSQSYAKQELWFQTVIVRDNSLQIERDANGSRFLNLQMGWAVLTTGLSTRTGFDIPLRDLLAWADGAPQLTVYETKATAIDGKYRRFMPPPGGRLRIAIDYDIDMAALTAKAAEIRAIVTQWTAQLGDFRTSCPQTTDGESDEIVVT
jgi:hypothetical protein